MLLKTHFSVSYTVSHIISRPLLSMLFPLDLSTHHCEDVTSGDGAAHVCTGQGKPRHNTAPRWVSALKNYSHLVSRLPNFFPVPPRHLIDLFFLVSPPYGSILSSPFDLRSTTVFLNSHHGRRRAGTLSTAPRIPWRLSPAPPFPPHVAVDRAGLLYPSPLFRRRDS
jgi:hypothetical protein